MRCPSGPFIGIVDDDILHDGFISGQKVHRCFGGCWERHSNLIRPASLYHPGSRFVLPITISIAQQASQIPISTCHPRCQHLTLRYDQARRLQRYSSRHKCKCMNMLGRMKHCIGSNNSIQSCKSLRPRDIWIKSKPFELLTIPWAVSRPFQEP